MAGGDYVLQPYGRGSEIENEEPWMSSDFGRKGPSRLHCPSRIIMLTLSSIACFVVVLVVMGTVNTSLKLDAVREMLSNEMKRYSFGKIQQHGYHHENIEQTGDQGRNEASVVDEARYKLIQFQPQSSNSERRPTNITTMEAVVAYDASDFSGTTKGQRKLHHLASLRRSL